MSLREGGLEEKRVWRELRGRRGRYLGDRTSALSLLRSSPSAHGLTSLDPIEIYLLPLISSRLLQLWLPTIVDDLEMTSVSKPDRRKTSKSLKAPEATSTEGIASSSRPKSSVPASSLQPSTRKPKKRETQRNVEKIETLAAEDVDMAQEPSGQPVEGLLQPEATFPELEEWPWVPFVDAESRKHPPLFSLDGR